jgi:mono/diheme cytochrome c family protein
MACAQKTSPPAARVSPAPAPVTPVALSADELPEGPGKRILTTACVACHALREVTKFRGFYMRPQWRDIVLTMVDYGAAVGGKDIDVLTDYLTEQLGKK